MEKKQKNGAARGGNIALIVACLAIILLPFVGWVIAGPLLLAAFICSIVAIAQNAARQGIVLMFGSILMPIIAQLVGIAMWAGIGAARSNEAKKQLQTPQAVSAAYNTVQTQPAQSASQPQAVAAAVAENKLYAATAQPTPDTSSAPMHMLKTVKKVWKKSGFGTVVVWRITFRNNGDMPISNIRYRTTYKAETGDVVDQGGTAALFHDDTIRKMIPPHQTRTIEVNDGFVHHETAKAHFEIVDCEYIAAK
jgi:hypothetical protein